MRTAIYTAKVFLSLWLGSPIARAQVKTQDLDISHNLTYVLMEDSGIGPRREFQAPAGVLVMAQFNTIDSPLTIFDVNRQNRRDIVEKISTLGIGARWALNSKWGLGFDFSASTVKVSDQKEDSGFGDTRIQLERRMWKLTRKSLGLSAIADVHLPTGEKDLFLSNGTFGGGLGLALEKQWKSMSGVLNIGFRKYGEAHYENIEMANQVPMGFGLSKPIGAYGALNAEGRWVYLPGDRGGFGTGEVYLGGLVNVGHNGKIHLGVGVSRVQSDNSSSPRIVAGYKFHPFLVKKEKAPTQVVTERVETIKETIKVVDRCGPQSRTEKFSARRMTPVEVRKHSILPYRSTPVHPIAVKQIGEMTGLSGNTPYVSDTQVLFAVDLFRMPERRELISLDAARLKMSVRKISKDHAKDTEILCLLNQKICSGEVFDQGDWKANVNPTFFGGKETPNDYFTKQYLSKPVETHGGSAVFAGDLVISLSKVIENSLVKDLFSVLYPKGVESARTLYFAVADDTYVSAETYLEINMTVDTCRIRLSNPDKGTP